jgi:hypothetical protein
MFLEDIKKISFSNGGTITMVEKKYKFINTCSIDYFLLVIHYIAKNNSYLVKQRGLQKNLAGPFYQSCAKIGEFLSVNNLCMARLEWAKFFKNAFTKTKKGTTLYDFYLHLEEAFYDKDTKKIQEFEFSYSCSQTCPVNFSNEKETSSKFLLM